MRGSSSRDSRQLHSAPPEIRHVADENLATRADAPGHRGWSVRIIGGQMGRKDDDPILVTGATGFIGRSLAATLCASGRRVVAGSRRPPVPERAGADSMVWRAVDLLRAETLPAALDGVRVAYYLVHSMGGGTGDFRDRERRAAEAFAIAAARAGVERIVYVGGPAPIGPPSEHLRSRLAVGEILRAGSVPTIELRASMVIGAGGASWNIVRDLAMRLPAMVLPRWMKTRSRPVALQDVVAALIGASDLPIDGSAWFDIPGPEILSGRQILERIAALRGRRIAVLEVPFLSPKLSALWLKLVTRTDFTLARELVLSLGDDLLPESDHFWERIGHTGLVSFDDAARLAFDSEPRQGGVRQRLVRLEEKLVDLTALFLPRRHPR